VLSEFACRRSWPSQRSSTAADCAGGAACVAGLTPPNDYTRLICYCESPSTACDTARGDECSTEDETACAYDQVCGDACTCQSSDCNRALGDACDVSEGCTYSTELGYEVCDLRACTCDFVYY
jgi:hypothetical protein